MRRFRIREITIERAHELSIQGPTCRPWDRHAVRIPRGQTQLACAPA